MEVHLNAKLLNCGTYPTSSVTSDSKFVLHNSNSFCSPGSDFATLAITRPRLQSQIKGLPHEEPYMLALLTWAHLSFIASAATSDS